MTDVTGFGLLGHLVEMCEGSGWQATLMRQLVPALAEDALEGLPRCGLRSGRQSNAIGPVTVTA